MSYSVSRVDIMAAQPVYRAGLAWLSPSAAPTFSAVPCSDPAVNSSPPVCRMLYSCSMAVSCWSSAKDSAKGTPKKRAEVVITQAPLPLKDRTLQALLEMLLTWPETQPLVVGGMMSRRAYSRSANDSSVGSKSDSLEISESGDRPLVRGSQRQMGSVGQTGISEILLVNVRANLVGLEVLVLDFGEGDHLGDLSRAVCRID